MKRSGKIFGALAMMAAMAGQTAEAATSLNNTAPVQEQQQKKKQNFVLPSLSYRTHKKQKSLLSGKVETPFKHHKKGVMNQRQLRKHLRSNPWQRKKYGK